LFRADACSFVSFEKFFADFRHALDLRVGQFGKHWQAQNFEKRFTATFAGEVLDLYGNPK
jgi:hypothetical protein